MSADMNNNKTKCPTLEIVHLLGKRWTVPVMEVVYFSEERSSFNTIKRALPGITPRNLSESLNRLCGELLMSKKGVKRGNVVYVEYRLTKKGRDLEKVVKEMKKLGVCWYGLGKGCTGTACGTCPAFTGQAK